MVPVDAYGASDERSMEADNTSAFNGRFVAGSSVWSQHAFGRAIDVDPLENQRSATARSTRRRRDATRIARWACPA